MALQAVDTVPCAERLEWISESAEARAYAAGHCRGCPIIDECGAAATAIGMRVGVWGGRDRTPRKAPAPTLPLFNDNQETA